MKRPLYKANNWVALVTVMIVFASTNYSLALNKNSPGSKPMANDSITLVGKLAMTGLPIHDVWEYTDPVTGTEYALLGASTSGLRVIDLSDKSNPVLVGSISGGVAAIDVKSWMNYAYVVGESLAVSGKIIDLTDPANPVQVSTFPAAHNIFITDSGYMYLSVPGLRIFDLAPDPINPVEIFNNNSCNGHDISVVGNRLYDFSNNCGTGIYDVTDPASPVLLGIAGDNSTFHHSGWPSSDGNYLFVCDELATPLENDIMVWDISNPAAPYKVDSFSDPNAYVHNLYVIDNYAYVSYYRAGFRVFDITDPTQIFLAAEYDTDSAISGPGYEGNFGLYPFNSDGNILASDENNGLYVFTFSGKVVLGLSTLQLFKRSFELYPNPAVSTVVLSFSLDESLSVSGEIYDQLGSVVKSISPVIFPRGDHRLQLDVQNVGSGLYVIKLNIGNTSVGQKIIITKE